jgi:hypothetical protein
MARSFLPSITQPVRLKKGGLAPFMGYSALSGDSVVVKDSVGIVDANWVGTRQNVGDSRFGRGWGFSGVASNNIVIPAGAYNLSTLFSISVWAKWSGSLGWGVLVGRDEYPSNRCFDLQTNNTGGPYNVIFNSSGSYTEAQTATNLWGDGLAHRQTMTYRYIANGSSVLTTYFDGRIIAQSTTAVGPVNQPNTKIALGATSKATPDTPWSGQIYSVLFYAREIPADEEMRLFLNSREPYEPVKKRMFYKSLAGIKSRASLLKLGTRVGSRQVN